MEQINLEEVERAILSDQTQLGTVWRLHQKGTTKGNIARELNVETTGSVDGWLRFVNRILLVVPSEVELPTPSRFQQYAKRLRDFLQRHKDQLSPETIEELNKRIDLCERRRRT